jgi:DNA-binding transcriptional LysR family regulator
MLAQLLNAQGICTKPVSASALASERLEEAHREGTEIVCVCTISSDGGLHARYLCKRLREQYPDIRIVAAILARPEARDNRKRELAAMANETGSNLSETVKRVQSLASVPIASPGQTAFSS